MTHTTRIFGYWRVILAGTAALPFVAPANSASADGLRYNCSEKLVAWQMDSWPWDPVVIWCDDDPTAGFDEVLDQYPAGVRTDAEDLMLEVVQNLWRSGHFFSSILGRSSWDNAGSPLQAVGINYGGADAEGSAPWVYLYGSADDPTRHYGRSADVVAHEFAHFMTGNDISGWNNPESLPDETAALAEGYSDVFASFVDRLYDWGSNDWEIADSSGFGAIRSLSDPTAYGGYECYSDFTAGMDYENSTIFSRIAYMLAEGGMFGKCGSTLHYVLGPIDTATLAVAFHESMSSLSGNSTFCDAYEALCDGAWAADPGDSWFRYSIDQAFEVTGIRQNCSTFECEGTPTLLYPYVEMDLTETGSNYLSVRFHGLDGVPDAHEIGYSTQDPQGDYEAWFEAPGTVVRYYPGLIGGYNDAFNIPAVLEWFSPQTTYHVVLRHTDPQNPIYPAWEYSSVFTTTTKAEPLIYNGSFELEDYDQYPIPDGWTTNGVFPTTQTWAKAKTGNSSVSIFKNQNHPHNAHAYLMQDVPVVRNSRYRVSGYVTVECEGDPNCYGTIMTECLRSDHSRIHSGCGLNSNLPWQTVEVRREDDWEKIVFDIRADHPEAAFVRMLCYNSPANNNNAIGTVWCDDMQMYRLPATGTQGTGTKHHHAMQAPLGDY